MTWVENIGKVGASVAGAFLLASCNSEVDKLAKKQFEAQGQYIEGEGSKVSLKILALYQDGNQPSLEDVAKVLGSKVPEGADENHIVGYFYDHGGSIHSGYVPITKSNMTLLHKEVESLLKGEAKGLSSER